MFAVIDINQVNNLLAFIRKENQPVIFCDSRGLFPVKRTGQPAPEMHRIFCKPGEFFIELGNDFYIIPDLLKLSRKVSVRLMVHAIRHTR